MDFCKQLNYCNGGGVSGWLQRIAQHVTNAATTESRLQVPAHGAMRLDVAPFRAGIAAHHADGVAQVHVATDEARWRISQSRIPLQLVRTIWLATQERLLCGIAVNVARIYITIIWAFHQRVELAFRGAGQMFLVEVAPSVVAHDSAEGSGVAAWLAWTIVYLHLGASRRCAKGLVATTGLPVRGRRGQGAVVATASGAFLSLGNANKKKKKKKRDEEPRRR